MALGSAVSAGRKRGLFLGAAAVADSDPARTTHRDFLSGESSGNGSCRLDLEPTDYGPALRYRVSHLCISHRNTTSTLDEMTLTWLGSRLPRLRARCSLMSILGALLSYYLVITLWRFKVLRNRRNRNQPIGKV